MREIGWNNTRTAAATKMKWNNLQVDKAGGHCGYAGLDFFFWVETLRAKRCKSGSNNNNTHSLFSESNSREAGLVANRSNGN
jgi:hypothetical protein